MPIRGLTTSGVMMARSGALGPIMLKYRTTKAIRVEARLATMYIPKNFNDDPNLPIIDFH